MRAHSLAMWILLLACRPPEVALSEAPPPDLASLSWMIGHWASPDGQSSETWTARGGAYVGVAFAPGKEGTWFEVLSIDDPGGALVYTARPGGAEPTAFAATGSGPQAARFENPHHDFPTSIAYVREGDALRARVAGPDGKGFDWEGVRADPIAAPDLPRSTLAPAGDAAFTARTVGPHEAVETGTEVTIWRKKDVWTEEYRVLLPD
jgi:hypothetical protein